LKKTDKNRQEEFPEELLLELKSIVLSYIKEFTLYHQPYIGDFEAGEKNLLKDFSGSFNYKQPLRCFKIGGVPIKNPVISAPLAGISDNTYRIFASAFGSALNFTEMISSYALHYKHSESLLLGMITEHERPCGVQLFGWDPAILSEAAEIVEQYGDMVDINMGCPVPKVLKAKSGGFLLTDEENIAKIISAVKGKIKKPVTVKVRLGWDKNSINIEKVAKIAEANGAGAITIHARTVKQGFSGEADYGFIKKVKASVKIPVIASGDIGSPVRAKQVLEETGCDGVMVGRAAKGNHWIFFDMLAALGIPDPVSGQNLAFITDRYFKPSIGFKQRFAKLYLKILMGFKGEDKAVREFRKHLVWIFKGVHGISRVKSDFFSVSSYEDTLKVINSIT
jgi:putative TIM-barrel protein, nifR3 family